MTELKTNPLVIKLLEHAEKSKKLSYDEISNWLPEEMIKSPVFNDVISLLESSGVCFVSNLEDMKNYTDRQGSKKPLAADTGAKDNFRFGLEIN
ncbi:MAG: hypothetical protein B0D92_08565, partial [Spirochaeta sp. LUC14_002_19_P3]